MLLAKGLGQGGMERLILTQMKFADRARFDYSVGYLVDRPHSVIGELRDLDVPVLNLSTGTRFSLGWMRNLHREMAGRGIDVLHAHSPMPAALTRPLVRVTDRKTSLVYTEHNRWNRYARPTRVANAATYWMDHAHFAVSDECASSMDRFSRRTTKILTHGIDLAAAEQARSLRQSMRDELGLTDDDIAVGVVANLRAQKNYPLLLDAARQVRDRCPGVRFLSAGQGPLEDPLKAHRDRLGLGDGFRFLGFRSDVLSVMSAFDVLCFSSDHEGLPVALMEARALGLPVVATAAGGLADHIRDREDGILIPCGDVDTLTDGILEVSTDRSLRDQLAAGSRSRATEFDAKRFVSVLEETYSELAQIGCLE